MQRQALVRRLQSAQHRLDADRHARISGHRPRLGPTGLPVVFAEGDLLHSYPAPVWSPGLDGDLLHVGWVFGNRCGTSLRIDDIYVLDGIPDAGYLRALLSYLDIEVELCGLTCIEFDVGGPGEDRWRLVPVLEQLGYRFVADGILRKGAAGVTLHGPAQA